MRAHAHDGKRNGKKKGNKKKIKLSRFPRFHERCFRENTSVFAVQWYCVRRKTIDPSYLLDYEIRNQMFRSIASTESLVDQILITVLAVVGVFSFFFFSKLFVLWTRDIVSNPLQRRIDKIFSNGRWNSALLRYRNGRWTPRWFTFDRTNRIVTTRSSRTDQIEASNVPKVCDATTRWKRKTVSIAFVYYFPFGLVVDPKGGVTS